MADPRRLVKVMQTMKANLAGIKLLVLDVDGVLTDGAITVDADGRESRAFNSVDGHGIRMWRRAGLKVAFISGRDADAVNHRARDLEIEHVFQGCHHKLPVLQKLLESEQLSPQQVAVVGDDLPDLPMMRCAGFAATVPDAVDEVRRHAHYVTTRPGGRGAVREVIEYILKATGKWQQLMKRYMP
jgi:3-deoxy-D-manno-octulosonate 8-phosphate phosphatase (KDO 8-P phosphatase)